MTLWKCGKRSTTTLTVNPEDTLEGSVDERRIQ